MCLAWIVDSLSERFYIIMTIEINGIIIEISKDRDIEIGVEPNDKIAVKITEGGMGCYEDEYTDSITIKDLYLFLKDKKKIFYDEANNICKKKQFENNELKKKTF